MGCCFDDGMRIAQLTSKTHSYEQLLLQVPQDVEAMQKELCDKNNTIKDLKKSNSDLNSQLETAKLQVCG